MRRYRYFMLTVAVLLTLSGQVLALSMHCSEQGMSMDMADMAASCHGQMTAAEHSRLMSEMEGDEASPSAPALSCDLLCGFCLSCNSMADNTALALMLVPVQSIDNSSSFLPASRLDHPFRPPIIA